MYPHFMPNLDGPPQENTPPLNQFSSLGPIMSAKAWLRGILDPLHLIRHPYYSCQVVVKHEQWTPKRQVYNEIGQLCTQIILMTVSSINNIIERAYLITY